MQTNKKAKQLIKKIILNQVKENVNCACAGPIFELNAPNSSAKFKKK